MTESLGPFDPGPLRLPQDFTETASVRKLLETIPVEKFKQDFFRTHPDPAYRIDSVGLLELKDERERYLARIMHEAGGCGVIHWNRVGFGC